MGSSTLSYSCADINKLLKRFQDDLLLDEESQAFLKHLAVCSKCKTFVRAIGSVSNQIWELGEIKVPEDLAATVIFKLQHSPRPSALKASPSDVTLRKILAGVAVIILILPVLFFSIGHMLKRGEVREAPAAPVMTVSRTAIEDQTPGEVKAVESDPVFAAVDDEAPPAEEPDEVPEEGVVDVNFSPAEPEPFEESLPGDVASKSLHWHVQLLDGAVDRSWEEIMARIDREIAQKSSRIEQLQSDISRLQKEGQAELGRYYSSDVEKKESQVRQQRDQVINLKSSEAEKLTADIRHLREERSRSETAQRQGTSEKQRLDGSQRTQMLNALNTLGIRRDWEGAGFIVFGTDGIKTQQALEQVLQIYKGPDSFRDFTEDVHALPGEPCRVSLFINDGEEARLHWHIDLMGSVEQSAVIEAIAPLAAAVNYQSGDSAVFTIMESKLEELRGKVRAMRVPLYEYGSRRSSSGILVSRPVSVSVYFMK